MVISRLKKMWHRLIGGTDEAVHFSRKNKKELKKIEGMVMREFRRRDVWAVRKEEVRRLAGGRKIWAIKCPAPDTDKKYEWGDYVYCMALKEVIERAGYYAVVECHEDWYEDIDADVALVMRGRHDYHPDRRNGKCRYIMWMVCHPDRVQDEEYALYDLVYVDSVPFAGELAARLPVPVRPLISGADTMKFHPAEDGDHRMDHDVIFVGNTRGEKRQLITWCEKHHIPVDIWGVGWSKFFKENEYLHFHGQMDYDELPELYRHSRVTLNDHFDAMREKGMVNNRMIEAAACGCPIVSDYDPSYEALPGGSVFYKNEDEFEEKIRYALEHSEELRRKAEASFPEIEKKYSLEACVAAMQRDLETICR